MELTMGLLLPREEVTIPMARHICRYALREIGVDDDCREDIEVALTEACTNVLDHSGPGDAYEVELSVEDDRCCIRIIDKGHGFDSETLRASDPAAEGGRGIELIRALVDRVKFESKPEAGTIVHLEKDLAYCDGAPAQRLASTRGGEPPG